METARLQDLLEEQLAAQPVSRLLDLGCGDGAATRRLLLAGLQLRQVTGVDPEDSGFFPYVARGDSKPGATLPKAWSFVRSDAHSTVHSLLSSDELPDMVVTGRMLHHIRRFGRLLGAAKILLRRCAESRNTPCRLVIWEPVAADGPLSELHRIKADVDSSLGLWHRPPFPRAVLERVLHSRVSGDDVRWDVLREVQASREPYTEAEYRSAIEDMHEYAGLVRERETLYAGLKRRLAMLPATPERQSFGEPLLLAIGSVSSQQYPPGGIR